MLAELLLLLLLLLASEETTISRNITFFHVKIFVMIDLMPDGLTY